MDDLERLVGWPRLSVHEGQRDAPQQQGAPGRIGDSISLLETDDGVRGSDLPTRKRRWRDDACMDQRPAATGWSREQSLPDAGENRLADKVLGKRLAARLVVSSVR